MAKNDSDLFWEQLSHLMMPRCVLSGPAGRVMAKGGGRVARVARVARGHCQMAPSTHQQRPTTQRTRGQAIRIDSRRKKFGKTEETGYFTFWINEWKTLPNHIKSECIPLIREVSNKVIFIRRARCWKKLCTNFGQTKRTFFSRQMQKLIDKDDI